MFTTPVTGNPDHENNPPVSPRRRDSRHGGGARRRSGHVLPGDTATRHRPRRPPHGQLQTMPSRRRLPDIPRPLVVRRRAVRRPENWLNGGAMAAGPAREAGGAPEITAPFAPFSVRMIFGRVYCIARGARRGSGWLAGSQILGCLHLRLASMQPPQLSPSEASVPRGQFFAMPRFSRTGSGVEAGPSEPCPGRRIHFSGVSLIIPWKNAIALWEHPRSVVWGAR